MSPTASTVIRALSVLFAGALVFQSAIILACLIFMLANNKAGYMQYRLPQLLFWIYLWVGLAAPASALVTAAVLWARRSSLRKEVSSADERALRRLKVLCAANVVAIALWLPFAAMVFLSAGGR